LETPLRPVAAGDRRVYLLPDRHHGPVFEEFDKIQDSLEKSAMAPRND